MVGRSGDDRPTYPMTLHSTCCEARDSLTMNDAAILEKLRMRILGPNQQLGKGAQPRFTLSLRSAASTVSLHVLYSHPRLQDLLALRRQDQTHLRDPPSSRQPTHVG